MGRNHLPMCTSRNEFVDSLANDGMELAQSRGVRNFRHPVWKYYSKKAVNTENKQYWQKRMLSDFNSWKLNTVNGYVYRMAHITKSKHYRREISLLNRDEIRTLLMLRTGHSGLPYFMFHDLSQGTDDQCILCTCPGTIEHYFF